MLLEIDLFAEGVLQSLGMNLYTLRHVVGMSLDELSEKIEIPRNQIEEMELGHYPNKTHVDFDLIIKIVRHFDAKLDVSIL